MQNTELIRLLVVDEQESYCKLLRAQLNSLPCLAGVDYEFAHSGLDAIKKIAAWAPTVVLLDAHLKDINSMSVLNACRSGGTTVVVASDSDTAQVADKARSAGASGYFAKSDCPEIIAAMLEEIVSVSFPVAMLH